MSTNDPTPPVAPHVEPNFVTAARLAYAGHNGSVLTPDGRRFTYCFPYTAKLAADLAAIRAGKAGPVDVPKWEACKAVLRRAEKVERERFQAELLDSGDFEALALLTAQQERARAARRAAMPVPLEGLQRQYRIREENEWQGRMKSVQRAAAQARRQQVQENGDREILDGTELGDGTGA
jgi:hypothetical protein